MSTPHAADTHTAPVSSAAIAQFLDATIPLYGASHRDVTEYGVHVPWRKAECYAVTNDGKRVSFARRWNFRGWAGESDLSSLLFDVGDSLVELMFAKRPANCGAEKVSTINLVSADQGGQLLNAGYIGTDGRMLRTD